MYFHFHFPSSFLFITISSVLSKPGVLDESLDTTLRLGTSTSDPRKTPQHDHMVSLSLTLAPPSGITTRHASPTKTSFPAAFGIKKNPVFKHPSKEKTPSRLKNHVNMYIEAPSVQFQQAMEDQSQIQHKAITCERCELQALRHKTATHHPQGSFTSTLPNGEVVTHNLHRYYALGVTPNQGFTSHEPNLDRPMKYQFYPVVDSSSSRFQCIQGREAQAEKEPTGTTIREETNLHPSKFDAKEVMISNDDKIIYPLGNSKDVARWVSLGKKELWACGRIVIDIEVWYDKMIAELTERLKDHSDIGIQTTDLRRALRRAKLKLIPSLLGFIIETKDLEGIQNHDGVLSEGWEFLKNYMAGWKDVDLVEVVHLLRIPLFECETWDSPEQVLAYLMRINPTTVLAYPVLSGFISSWKMLKGH
ncbi:uncharacterized protein MELLADRAFT_102286 [Melampsora larici-populina 98AG31]|uniref:Secreted protein n=1 Tax=Melampsora larici-populina (strain 98AG31 / pathotype 3-4-7) TaxID=747676 RepID=F4R7T0_MELLP|nr:uncharacterized protein MELLADRAFT_102286 [Melampsora larici-populina 98AG31]EGG11368.1 hypothetical protein MELLADRAFT_102286 [Melampsora larici-populina 98AG31]